MKLNRILFIPAACLALSVATVSCDSEGDDNVQWWDWSTSTEDPEPTPEPEPALDANPEIVALGWTNVTLSLEEQYGNIPDYIQMYKSPEKLCDKKAYAYIAVADKNQVTLDVLGDAENLVTPSTRYDECLAPVLVNGGYFYQNSLSLILRDGELICPNVQVDSPDWTSTYYYTPRGTFSILEDGSIEVSWVYTLLSGVSYSYPTSMPLENGVVPSASYPEGGKEYSAQTAIGGGPVLTLGGEVINSWENEFLSVSVDSNRPRTAIGYNPTTERIVIFACAGDGVESVNGLTLDNTANVLLSLGCTESINLDGGGSTVMLFNGNEIIKSSDGTQRRVGSCAAFK